jgi:hypothetical protein
VYQKDKLFSEIFAYLSDETIGWTAGRIHFLWLTHYGAWNSLSDCFELSPFCGDDNIPRLVVVCLTSTPIPYSSHHLGFRIYINSEWI